MVLALTERPVELLQAFVPKLYVSILHCFVELAGIQALLSGNLSAYLWRSF